MARQFCREDDKTVTKISMRRGEPTSILTGTARGKGFGVNSWTKACAVGHGVRPPGAEEVCPPQDVQLYFLCLECCVMGCGCCVTVMQMLCHGDMEAESHSVNAES